MTDMGVSAIPTLVTERLVLRAWRDSDLDAFAEFWANEETARFVGGVCNREDAWRRIALFTGHWTLRGYGPWALEERRTNLFVGYCGLWFPEGWPEPEVCWSLLAQHQGRGYASEAARHARNFAYRELGWKTSISLIAPENVPSQRVATRLGAVLEREIVVRDILRGLYRHPAPETLN